ncbi:MAG: ATP-binding cassette domain-containing protein [Sedimentisphaerales bacterium]
MIRTEQISFHIGAFALQGISCEIATGQYFVLLGPPGSGKTIFLECLCGLKKIDSGRIYIDGREVTALEPRARNIGYVPQDYALFPHLSVEQNIAFGLRVHGYQRKEIMAKVTETVELLEIQHLLPRRIYGLSGGEKQRVALARALVLQPKVLLLDEPVCALDEVTRQEVCAQLFRIQRQLSLTTIHVSHNLEEAFSVADRAAILHQGLLQQVGSLNELLRKPNSEFVARFMRCENIFCGKVVGQSTPPSANCDRDRIHTQVKVGNIQLRLSGQYHGQVKFMIRPEDILVFSGSQDNAKGENKVRAKLECWRDCGSYVRIKLDGPVNLVAHMTHAAFAELQGKLQPLDSARRRPDVTVVLRPENIHVLGSAVKRPADHSTVAPK